jgi:hypothetical protein
MLKNKTEQSPWSHGNSITVKDQCILDTHAHMDKICQGLRNPEDKVMLVKKVKRRISERVVYDFTITFLRPGAMDHVCNSIYLGSKDWDKG